MVHQEMDVIASRVPMRGLRAKRLAFPSVLNFVEHLMLDSVMLFEDFSAYRLTTPESTASARTRSSISWGFIQARVRSTVTARGG